MFIVVVPSRGQARFRIPFTLKSTGEIVFFERASDAIEIASHPMFEGRAEVIEVMGDGRRVLCQDWHANDGSGVFSILQEPKRGPGRPPRRK